MADTQFLTLIDYVPVYVTLAQPPGGGLWTVAATNRKDGTGYSTAQVAVIGRGHTAILDFHGAQVTSLSEDQLAEEAVRMRKVVEAANLALKNIEEHLAFRRSL